MSLVDELLSTATHLGLYCMQLLQFPIPSEISFEGAGVGK
jgi:hypothetical protein